MRNSIRYSLTFGCLLLVAGVLFAVVEQPSGSNRFVGWIFLKENVPRRPRILHGYDFIRYDKNLIIRTDEHALAHFYRSMDSLSNHLKRKVNVVHIGDSHVQADYFPGRIRENMQRDTLLGNGGRGMVFPGSLIGSNNSYSIRVGYTGRWSGCKNSEWSKQCNWGITGMTATTIDPAAGFTINPNTTPELTYPVTRVKIFYPNNDPASFTVRLVTEPEAVVVRRLEHPAYTEFVLSNPASKVTVRFEKVYASQKHFVLQGVSLENDLYGVQYQSLGVNGADVYGFGRSPMLEEHLRVLRPDLVVISLGTNDAYPKSFDANVFKRNYGQLLQRIRRASPNASILLTTPGDCQRYARYPNTNNILATRRIKELAEETGSAVWDFYIIMGGLNSIRKWQSNGLAGRDRLHLTGRGYTLQGGLMYDALMADYYAYTTKFPLRKLEVSGK